MSAQAESYVRIFDTTLRDGEQSPGASLTRDEKLLLAGQIASLGVDVIETGFPAASPDDLLAVQLIAREIGTLDGPIITGLARAQKGDIDKAWEAVQPAAQPRIHTFLATSDLHLEHKLGMSRQQVIDQVGDMVAYARSLSEDVEFSPEDAGRSDPDYLVQVLTVAIQAGATTLNIPDTVGYTLPQEYGELIARLIRDTPGSEKVIWSVHCHDDLGLATANTLAGIQAGARQAEVTMNGIGERAGNTSLEEVVMALATRQPKLGLSTGINSRRLVPVSRLVSRYTGIQVPPNKAVVGSNAFAHEAGIHQDGMLKDQRTYEIMTPESVGLAKTRLVLGKHSGRHAFRVRLEEMGFTPDDATLHTAFKRFKALADRKKVVTDSDLRALLRGDLGTPPEHYRLASLQVSCGPPSAATATVTLHTPTGEEKVGADTGSGSVDAVFRAIRKIIGSDDMLVDFKIQNVTEGIDALGEVSVRISPRDDPDTTHYGYGADTDIIVASARAYLAAINRKLAASGFEAPCPLADRPRITVAASTETDEPFDPHYTAGI